MTFETVAEGLEFPEGPIAMEDGSVLLVEIKRRTLSRVIPDGRIDVVAEVGGGPNGVAIGPDGAAYVCNNGGRFTFIEHKEKTFPSLPPAEHKGGMIQRVDLATGKFETLYDSCEGEPLWAPNDIVFDRQGGFWFTDHGRNDGKTLNLGGVYYALVDGSKITRQRGGMISANGVGLSPDEATLYVADTQLARLWSFPIEAPGVLGPAPFRRHGDIVTTLNGFQLLDSLAVEANGFVCVATLMNGGISVFNPEGGVEHLPFPDPMITNISFGGDDMRDAWITASASGKLFKTRWPRPGLKLNFNA